MSHIKIIKESRLSLNVLSESSIIDFILLSSADTLLYKVFFLSWGPFSQLSISDMSIGFLLRPIQAKSRLISGFSGPFLDLGLALLMMITSLTILFLLLIIVKCFYHLSCL
jgi:hypothetical protein